MSTSTNPLADCLVKIQDAKHPHHGSLFHITGKSDNGKLFKLEDKESGSSVLAHRSQFTPVDDVCSHCHLYLERKLACFKCEQDHYFHPSCLLATYTETSASCPICLQVIQVRKKNLAMYLGSTKLNSINRSQLKILGGFNDDDIGGSAFAGLTTAEKVGVGFAGATAAFGVVAAGIGISALVNRRRSSKN